MSLITQESIGEKIARLLEIVAPEYHSTIATVTSINQEEGSCICLTSNKEEHKVRLMGSFDSPILIIPKINSTIIINFLDNIRTKGYVIGHSEIEKILLTGDSKIEIENHDINIKVSPEKVHIVGEVEIEGDIVCHGEITAKSESSPVNVSSHKQSGPAGPPVPEP